MAITKKVMFECWRKEIRPQFRWIPRRQNAEADAASKRRFGVELKESVAARRPPGTDMPDTNEDGPTVMWL